MVRKIKKNKKQSLAKQFVDATAREGFLEKEVERLKKALEPFANVPLPGDVNEKGEPAYGCAEPSGESVWFYTGKADYTDSHVKLNDFREARKALRLPNVITQKR